MEPRAYDFRALARQSLAGYWGTAVLICFIAALLGDGALTPDTIIMSRFRESIAFFPFMGFVALFGVAIFVISGAVELGVNTVFCRKVLRDMPEPAVASLFDRFNILGKALGLSCFRALFVFLWSLLLVVPGIIASLRYAMASYLMAEHPGMGIREAMDESKRLMRGNCGRLFCLELSFIGWVLLSALTCGIGLLWLTPYIKTAESAFYLHLTGRVLETGQGAAQD
ncbi:MAG: DUF975 family protein [Clostridiales bacterium]|jgi:uncharacterized membrane protein|nr:DUF975 family protein [Clostridiales bacterium]